MRAAVLCAKDGKTPGFLQCDLVFSVSQRLRRCWDKSGAEWFQTNSYLLETYDNLFHSATTSSWKSTVQTGNAWDFSMY